MLLPCVPTCIVYDRKSAVILVFVPLFLIPYLFFIFVYFYNALFFLLILSNLIIVCLGVVFFMILVLTNLENFDHYFSNIFSVSPSSLGTKITCILGNLLRFLFFFCIRILFWIVSIDVFCSH